MRVYLFLMILQITLSLLNTFYIILLYASLVHANYNLSLTLTLLPVKNVIH